MFPPFHVASFSGALGANLLLFGSILASLAQPWCGDVFCRGGRPEAMPLCCTDGVDIGLQEIWEPYVDNPKWPGDGPPCPTPQGRGDSVALLYGPLPALYRPLAPRPAELFACVSLAPDGSVAGARLRGSSGSAELDSHVLALMRSRWQFTEPPGAAAGAWQRVRLSGMPRRILS